MKFYKKILLVLGIIFAICYIAVSLFFNTHFCPETYINGEDVSMCNKIETMKKLGYSSTKSNNITFMFSNNVTEKIKASDVDYESNIETNIENLYSKSSGFLWPFRLFGVKEYEIDFAATYNKLKLENQIKQLGVLSLDMVPSQNAYIDYSNNDFVIIPEVIGTDIDINKLISVSEEKLSSGINVIDAVSGNCYVLPEITASSPQINKMLSEIQAYKDLKIEYDFMYTTETVDKNVIMSFLNLNDGVISVNEDNIKQYVKKLAAKYDTYLSDRAFTTHDNRNITVSGGIYGWQIDINEETKALAEDIIKKSSITREPIYSIKGFYRSAETDIGNTYIEISLDAQHLWMYQNGELTYECDVVTGYPGVNTSTPVGVFCVWSRENGATLDGPGYSTHVSYWMPIDWNGVGLHDAVWQSAFGGSIYKTNGSHGCINLSLDSAATIYSLVKVRTPVIIY